jgi:hypothetical protein
MILSLNQEQIILVTNAALMGYAYFWAYPALTEKTIAAITFRDAVISCMALLLAGALFWGTDQSFTLVFFETNWLVFSIVTLIIIEIPLFLWFLSRFDLS